MTPYRILTGILLACAAMALLLAAFPGATTSASESLVRLDIVVALILVVAAALTWFIAPRVPNGWGLDGLILVAIAIACIGAALVPTGEAQVLVGLGLSLFAVFAGYFRPRARFYGLLAAVVVGYSIAALVNPVMSNLAALLAVLAVIAGVSTMVNVQSVRMQELVLHDPLTGTLNRRGLEFHASQVALTANRSGTPVTVGLVDLDNFKGYNDEHGHAAGDDALVQTADAWMSQVRANDLVVRYGGDEFAVVLVGMALDEATALAARVEAEGTHPWSVGFTGWEPGEDVYDALARADAAMFKDKT